MDTAKSVRFILDRGSGLEKARIRWILYGVEPEPNVTLRLSELQNADGGFPFDMVKGNLSTIDSTLVALWWMEELGMLASATADRTYTHLLTVQQDDGGWDEDPAIAQYDLPPWVRPGELGTRLYLSSYAAYWLAVAGYQTVPAFRKVLDFVVRHQDETRHVPWVPAYHVDCDQRSPHGRTTLFESCCAGYTGAAGSVSFRVGRLAVGLGTGLAEPSRTGARPPARGQVLVRADAKTAA
jgi:hypothetical protein